MKYGFKTYKAKVEAHEFWVVESTELKGCVAQAETLEQALEAFAINEKDWLDTAREVGINIPEASICDMDEYSGKLSLRLPKTLHRQLAEVAIKEGVSINSLLNTYIAKGIGNWAGERKIINVTVQLEQKEEIFGQACDRSWSNYEKAPNRINDITGFGGN
jgi:predicted HicB family RNase H-like nuclease